jgi:hypothetical protein
VQTPSGVLVDHEEPARFCGEAMRQRAGRFRSPVERALGPVGREAIWLAWHGMKLKRLTAGCVRHGCDTLDVEDLGN